MNYEDMEVEELEQQEEGFTISNDSMAEWALKKIKAENDETERLITMAKNEISRLNEKIMEYEVRRDKRNGFLKAALWKFFGTVSVKETKTQQSYELLSGKLVFKKPTQKLVPNKEAILQLCKNKGMNNFVKVKEELDWAEYKKELSIVDGKVMVLETGEIYPDELCTVEETAGSFEVK